MPELTTNRVQRRKARTRAALLDAARHIIATGRLGAPILEITQEADVGLGSFYNHFNDKDELFRAAIEEALTAYGQALDDIGESLMDPAARFALGIRLTGRLHRRNPELSKVLLHHGLSLAGPLKGLVPLGLREIEAGMATGRFSVRDPQLALVIATGAAEALGQLLHDQPERDDAEATDQVTEDLLRMMGVPPHEAHDLSRGPLPDIDRFDRDIV